MAFFLHLAVPIIVAVAFFTLVAGAGYLLLAAIAFGLHWLYTKVLR